MWLILLFWFIESYFDHPISVTFSVSWLTIGTTELGYRKGIK